MGLTDKNGIEISIFFNLFTSEYTFFYLFTSVQVPIDSNMLVFKNAPHLNDYLAGH